MSIDVKDNPFYKEMNQIVLDYHTNCRTMTDNDILENRARLSTLVFYFIDSHLPTLTLNKSLATIEIEAIDRKLKKMESDCYQRYVQTYITIGYPIKEADGKEIKSKISISKADDMARKIFHADEKYYEESMSLIRQKQIHQKEIDEYWNFDKMMSAVKDVMISMVKRFPHEFK